MSSGPSVAEIFYSFSKSPRLSDCPAVVITSFPCFTPRRLYFAGASHAERTYRGAGWSLGTPAYENLRPIEVTRIVTSHYLDFLRNISSRALVLCEGRIVADEPMPVIFHDRALVRAANLQ